jgi:hypothetical protein
MVRSAFLYSDGAHFGRLVCISIGYPYTLIIDRMIIMYVGVFEG